MISIKKLQVFSSIARHGNLTAAAAELYLSKAAVSQALSELEQQLAAPLFDRVHPRLKLNAQGKLLQPLADEVLSRVMDIEQLFQQQQLQGQLGVGASQTIGNYLLPALLTSVAPGQVRVSIENTYSLCQQLLQFELDLALIEGDNPFAELAVTPWLQDEMILVAPPQHPLAKVAVLDYCMLEQQAWVLREMHSGSRSQFNQLLAPKLTKIGPITELTALEAIMAAVEAGLGLTFISSHAAASRLAQGRLVRLTLPDIFTRQLSLVWHKQKYHSALARAFIQRCQQYYR
ncbi:LysR family transcriptional regulator [Alishewanella sp. d11]|uniref:LysR family transcriptional regulator n=1 Tax=Alishewanella sp. d11 TaxID=3414030 RepID=UPI003BF854BA